MLAIEVIISLIILLGLIFQTGNLAAICMNILTRPRLDIIITDVVFFIILCWFNFQDILSLSVLVSGSSALMIIRNAFATAISLHAISTGCIRMRRNRYSINPYSVKEAIDTMDAGIAFFDNGYKLLLSNVIMNSLLTDDISRTIKYNSGFISVIDGKSYEFSKETISSGDFTFIQVMAVDITEALQLNHDLELKNMELAATGEKLAKMIENMESIKVQETRLAMRGRIHDALAQRLTAVHMFLEKNESLNVDELKPLILDIKSDMAPDEDSNDHQLRVIINAFRVIGLDITINGLIPDEYMELTASVLREAATNAVRHANASELTLSTSSDSVGFRFTIQNDGMPACEHFTPGGGLTAMRHSIEKAGGSMDIHTAPAFTLVFSLPPILHPGIYESL